MIIPTEFRMVSIHLSLSLSLFLSLSLPAAITTRPLFTAAAPPFALDIHRPITSPNFPSQPCTVIAQTGIPLPLSTSFEQLTKLPKTQQLLYNGVAYESVQGHI